jgi:hypothetical protein
MIAITGNTYPVKDQIRALGGRCGLMTDTRQLAGEVLYERRSAVSAAYWLTQGPVSWDV